MPAEARAAAPRARGAAPAAPHVVWVNHFARSPREGGGTRHVELGRELVRRGWHVSLYAADLDLLTRRYTRRASGADRHAHRETVDGVDICWLWSAPYARNDWRRLWNWLSFARGVRALAPSTRPDVVIGSSPHLLAADASLALARRLRVPFVFEVRDLWPETLVAAGKSGGPFEFVLGRLARRLYHAADRIVVLAAGVGDYLVERRFARHEQIVYVPNGVDVDAFSRPRHRPVDERPVVFVYAGAHGPLNGLDVVIDAAALLRDRDDVRFLLVGDGPAKPELRARASALGLSNVEFRDPVPKSDMPALLADADAGLMVLREAPLFSFGVSPNKLFDYFGAALPVACNVPGDVAGMLADAGAGEQAADASPAALAAAVSALADASGEERRRLGAAGRAWVAREHDRGILAARLDAALREVVRR